MKTILSICVVTMNRAKQLKEALESCLACVLPNETEFIIVDNASTDRNEYVVSNLMGKVDTLSSIKEEMTNIGAGAGRNRYFEMSRGEYIYGMDDDAVIDHKNNPDFFIRSVKILDENPAIVALATQIYDEAWEQNRQTISAKEILPNVYKCQMFCGGSHFLRKSFFSFPPYWSNKYGYEELPPSLIAFDNGQLCAFCSNLFAIHKPAVNKWVRGDEKNSDLLINECAVQYAIKKMMYPALAQPLVWLAFKRRCQKHLSHIPQWKKRAKAVVKDTISLYPVGYKMKMKTVKDLYRNFGISVF